MKARALTLLLVFGCAGVAAAVAQEPMMGAWRLNDSKSQISQGAPRVEMSVYEAVGDSIKVTSDGKTGDGKPMHSEWTGKFDGKDYPVTGGFGTGNWTRSYTLVNDHTLKMANKRDDKVDNSGEIVVSPDGKTRTVHITGTDASGRRVSVNAVYDKQ